MKLHFTLWIDKRTDTGSVRNALHTKFYDKISQLEADLAW
ncbi:hypothetical protein HydSN_0066 [Hydrogenobaculum sp. SN]|nr:hypothetical protein Hyd3684_0062 [Hydrogenobaculum sp. 3684]AEG45761.1 hypothetical protein HydSHO_0063 [Hydrogenobaculum sp. SHO]AGG14403.1 hypothetical protein HydHO_0063 [Hydrogenobaculum sp. HO]AGH92707.1 hypothetical protein HydSN_0066 [Hydrogenobaculum sp. SN]